jgi:hypothetical protein
MGEVERVLPERRVGDAEAPSGEVVSQGSPGVVVRVDHHDERVVPFWA